MKEKLSKDIPESSAIVQSSTNKLGQSKSRHQLKPILLIENLDKNFGDKKHKKTHNKISKQEEILLTLIANIIVEIIIKEEL